MNGTDAAMAGPERFPRLAEVQLEASNPRGSAWLSASAGTGKTQVLTARVLRLLLAGVEPGAILCLTFTKAGATEMAQRIHARLAQWVRLKSELLARDLLALGEDIGPQTLDHARTLFARVLDAPGGGLRIETIHAFAQSLMAAFPLEAEVTPGFRPLDGRDEVVLRHTVLADLLVRAEVEGDLGLIDDVQKLSLRLGEEGARSLLAQASRAPDALAALGPREGIEARLRRELGLPAGDIETAIAEACGDGRIDCAAVVRIAEANRHWGTATGLDWAERAEAWLAAGPVARAAGLGDLLGLFRTQAGEPRKVHKGLAAVAADYEALAQRLGDACAEVLALRQAAAAAALVAASWRAGQAFARAYGEAKRATGVVDFDDLIRGVERLLQLPGIGEWVRYKLDRSIDHILVDEGQDTNPRQWAIVGSLAAEFFSGEGAGPRNRTIFTVGDYKQAIFGFQGTSPIAFEAARIRFSAEADAGGKPIADLSLDKSYRSTPPILTVVDRLIETLGGATMGLSRPAPAHLSAREALPGSVMLWQPVVADGGDIDEAEEGWINDATRLFATRLARQVREWLGQPLWLGASGRSLRPEDILILVRRRGDLAGLIVARLHAEDVPVAGVDRLRLGAPLAVRDLLAAIRFALQPEDDLTLAALLVSPLIGWSQGQLYDLAHERGPISLWRALRQREAVPEAMSTLLAMADFATPYQLLETILSGPLDGRSRLIERLGEEARDPIEELLNAALQFEDNDLPSLQRFLDWIDRDDFEISRDPSAPHDAVRVMTVHGAKGLQAPLVILADAAFDPDRTPARAVALELDGIGAVPIFRPRKDERIGALDEAVRSAEARDREEHWRLLYVAATRAEEMLVIGGALGPACRGVAPVESWYAKLDLVLAGLGADWQEDSLWSKMRSYPAQPAATGSKREGERPAAPALPDWVRRPAPREARPPRPLAPSAIGDDNVAEPPPGPAVREAARRGTLLHALFERLPAVAADRREDAAMRWLITQGVEEAATRAEIVEAACGIIADPALADLFAAEALAEAPIAAVVDGVVVAGTVDRLMVGGDLIRVVDFKTGRRVPETIGTAPEHHLRQIAAYAAALAVIFPGRAIEASLLYTAGPRLLSCPPELLARYKPRLPDGE
jgi:ATP-dependent helicase/nuclease subunit A